MSAPGKRGARPPGRPPLEVGTRPITLRLPADVEDGLRAVAGAATLQAVIVGILRESLSRGPGKAGRR